jgi:hypothetical protein
MLYLSLRLPRTIVAENVLKHDLQRVAAFFVARANSLPFLQGQSSTRDLGLQDRMFRSDGDT